MFNGFPTTQTPAVQWWDYSKPNAGTINIALPNDCAPVQFFATGGSATTIEVTLPPSPPQGKTITIKNDRYGNNSQKLQINDGNEPYISPTVLGVAAEATFCYISQNTLTDTNQRRSNWIRISGGSAYSGQFAASIGGYANNASGFTSTTLGGWANNASGMGAAVVGGSNNTASGTFATVFGGVSTANSSNSFVVGYTTTAKSIAGNVVFGASDSPLSGGAQQLGLLNIVVQTTDATPTALRSNTSAASTTNQVILPNNSVYYFRGECVAGVTGAGNSAMWSFEGGIKRGANAASTVLVGTPVLNLIASDAGASTWVIALTTDTTNGGLRVTVTGQASTTIRWSCQIRTTEMGF